MSLIRSGSSWTNKQDNLVRELHRRGCYWDVIAEKTGRSLDSIKRRFRVLNLSMPRKHKQQQPKPERPYFDQGRALPALPPPIISKWQTLPDGVKARTVGG